MKALVALHVAAVAAIVAAAAPPPQPTIQGAGPLWFESHGSPRTDWTNRLVELPDGSLVAAGFVNRDDVGTDQNWDAFLRKYGADGRTLWSRRIGGPQLEAAWAVLPLREGFAVAGFASSNSVGGWDAALTLVDQSGQLRADHRFGGSGDDRATDLVNLGDGLLLVGQSDSSGAGGADVFLVRTDLEGKEVWRRTYGTAADDRGFFGVALPGGGAIIAGVTGPRGAYDLLLMRVANDGQLVWRRVIAGDGNDAAHGLASLPDGSILLTGYGPSWNGRGNDMSLLHFTIDGKLLSHEAIGAADDDRVQFIAVDDQGGAWLTGYTRSFSSEWRMLIARMGANGRLEPWLGAIGGPGEMNGSTIAVAKNGDLLIGGYSTLPSAGSAPPDAFAMRVQPSRIERRKARVQVRDIPINCRADDEVQTTCR